MGRPIFMRRSVCRFDFVQNSLGLLHSGLINEPERCGAALLISHKEHLFFGFSGVIRINIKYVDISFAIEFLHFSIQL